MADAYKFFYSAGYLNVHGSLGHGCLSWIQGMMHCQPMFAVAYIR